MRSTVDTEAPVPEIRAMARHDGRFELSRLDSTGHFVNSVYKLVKSGKNKQGDVCDNIPCTSKISAVVSRYEGAMTDF
jgi:hypothetical protein